MSDGMPRVLIPHPLQLMTAVGRMRNLRILCTCSTMAEGHWRFSAFHKCSANAGADTECHDKDQHAPMYRQPETRMLSELSGCRPRLPSFAQNSSPHDTCHVDRRPDVNTCTA